MDDVMRLPVCECPPGQCREDIREGSAGERLRGAR